MNISLVAAKAENGVIGNGYEIPWRAKGEQKLFKEITMGGVLIMGRKTYESIGKPLPGRETIVISRGTKNYPEPIKVCSTLSLALESAAQLKKPIFVIGGGEVYSQAISLADSIHLTQIHCRAEGDVFFPEIPNHMRLKKQCHYESNINYTYEYYERVKENEI